MRHHRQPRRRVLGTVAVAVVVGSVLGGCTVEQSATTTSMAPLIDPADLPEPPDGPAGDGVGTVDTTPDAGTSTAAATNAIPVVRLLPQDGCAYADALPLAEITFVVGTRLYGADVEGRTVRCLADLPATARGAISWSPIANRALVGTTTLLDVAGLRGSGVEPADVASGSRLVWEFPVGDALLSASADGSTLVRRSAATGVATSATFLRRTTRVAAHPSGRLVVAAGVATDGSPGIFASDLRGPAPGVVTPLVLFADADTGVADLAVDGTGDTVVAAIGGRGAQQLVRIALVDLSVRGLAQSADPISTITTGASATNVAWATGLCNSQTRTWTTDPRTGTPTVVGAGGPLDRRSVAPVAWIDPARLMVASRSFGCDGPADIWIWNALDGTITLFARGVEQPALRKLLPGTPTPAVGATGQASVL